MNVATAPVPHSMELATTAPQRRKSTIRASLNYIGQQIPIKLKLSTIFKEIITISISAVTIAAIVILGFASPSYYGLKLIPPSSSNAEFGLHYESHGIVKLWVIQFLSVSKHDNLLVVLCSQQLS